MKRKGVPRKHVIADLVIQGYAIRGNKVTIDIGS